uniref:Transport and Golgi organization protein 1 homolog n=1 Tax=Hucho hucho TaxID=62062 RepID=A0A4W5P3Q8_9TELE
MAVNVSYVYIFILCIHNFISKVAVERRFSDFKRCADEECSMLLRRGKAFSDFTGPDCRFLSFKKGETIYVYYKLSGQRTNIWAGSVGNRFGYFNKDQLVINHIYTEKELEIPAEETDFVCFDSGHNKFDSYDIDSLLGSSLLLTDKEESVQVTTETFYLNKSAESTTVEVDEPEVTLLENDEIDRDVPEDIDKVVEVPDDDLRHFEALESSLPQPETLDTKGVESNTVLETTAERIKDYLQKDEQRTEDSVPYSVVEPEEGEIKETPSEPLSKDDPELENAPGGFSEGRPIPELKTTLGITFHAVTSDDEDTWKVTPYDEEDEESDKTEYQQDEESDYHLRETPLLAFSEESSNLEHENIPESYQTDEEDSQSEVPHTQKQDSKDNNLWSSFGDTVFNIVSGGERIAHVAGSEKDDEEEDDDEGEITPEEPPKIEEPKESEEVEQPSELIFEEPADSNFSEDAVKVPDEDSQTLQFEDESEEGDIEPSTPPADEASPFEHTEALAENLTVDDSPVPKQLSQTDMLSDFDSKTNESEQKQAVELPIQKEESRDFSQVENTFKQGGTELFRLFREPYQKVPDPSKNTMVKESHQELSIEEDSIHLKGEDIEEELLEDENAVLSSSKTEHTDEKDTESLSEFGSEQPNNYTQTNVVSSDVLDVVQHDEAIDIEHEVHETENYAESHTPSLKDKVLDPLPNKETEYSDDVLRLTLLRDHFKDEDMECLQKILGLQNLFRVEFLFSDLELKAARLSQTNTSEDIEKVLEAILEASETPILDEIERMLDAQENADLQQEAGEFVEEAAVLDNFQELVFTLRQWYSMARNSALMAVGSQLHLDTDGDISDDAEEEKTFPHSVEDTDKDNLTVTETGEETKAPEKPAHDGHKRPDMGIEEDGGYFNRNKDNQPSSKTLEEIQRGPQTILENTLDTGLSVHMDHPPSGSLESPPVTDFHEDEQSGSSFLSVLILSGCLVTLFYEYLGIYGVMVSCFMNRLSFLL